MNSLISKSARRSLMSVAQQWRSFSCSKVSRMLVGVVKEIKVEEYRVGLTPAGCRELISRGHEVVIQKTAGLGSGFSDADYEREGAQLVDEASEVFGTAECIIHVKELLPPEIAMLRKDQLLFTYLHLAPDRPQTDLLLKSGATCIAYETVTRKRGHGGATFLPLLEPMSRVAGRLSIQKACQALERPNGGRGMLLGGVPGTRKAHVVIIGAGVVGMAAARMAVGFGARVTLLDNNNEALQDAVVEFGVNSGVETLHSNHTTIEFALQHADVVIGSVLLPGKSAPKLITKRMMEKVMPRGSVFVDVAIDQGGCSETSRPTTHRDPTYRDGNDVIHYCVTNMPGCVPRTSTFALTDATLPYMLSIADLGLEAAVNNDEGLREGVNVHKGLLVNSAVAESQERKLDVLKF